MDGDCSHEIKRRLLLGRKAMTNLDQIRSVAQSCLTLCDPMNCSMPDSVLKSKDITLPTKVFIVKTIVSLLVVYRCESWTTKAEHLRVDGFEQRC